MATRLTTRSPYTWLAIAGGLILLLFGLQLHATWVQNKGNIPQLEIQETDPVRGTTVQPVMSIIEFSDFQCPFCAEQAAVLKQFTTEHGDQVAHVWKDYPLEELHAEAGNAAEVARCSQLQGKFWQMHDWLFDHQADLSSTAYQQAANELGLNVDSFNACLTDHATVPWIRQNFNEAESVGFRSVPVLIINGQVYEDVVSLSTLQALLTQLQ